MQDVYRECPVLENGRFLLRLIEEGDAEDLLQVYSDKRVLPFLNSDNCHGDNFYMTRKEDVQSAIHYWLKEYAGRGFVRFTVVDRKADAAVGTIELFRRRAEDYFNDCGLLRLDLRYDYENPQDIAEILAVIVEPAYSLFGCSWLATKAPVYAVDRIEGLRMAGFEPSDRCLAGSYGGRVYDGYWIIRKDGKE